LERHDEFSVLLIVVGGSHYAIALKDVAAVMRPLPAHPAPHAPPWVTGLAVIRGSPVPVIDLGRRLGLTQAGPPERLVLVHGPESYLALLVDGLAGIRPVPGRAEAPHGLVPPGDLIVGWLLVDGTMVALLDVTAVLEPGVSEYGTWQAA
jgi:purine-binding chemotaxis protein CheW